MASQSDFDAAQTDRDSLKAQLRLAEASIQQTEASLKTSRANLDFTRIHSPVNGVVVSRNVDEGQTVVSSMNAATLYMIATDLSTIQVVANIAESDVGGIVSGQSASFTVDAYRNTFTGSVKQVRMAASTVQNVVTFPVIVQASNPELKLFPGMTANLAIETGRNDNALIVPSAALRFTPEDVMQAEEAERANAGGRGTRRRGGSRIWIVGADGKPEAVDVQQQLTDGTNVSIVPQNASVSLEGREVILGAVVGAAASAPNNPFAPRMPAGTGTQRR